MPFTVIGALQYEAFRCLIDYYGQPTIAPAAAKAAAALTTIAKKVAKDIEAVLPTTEFRQDILEPSQNEFIAHCYDFLHPFMTEEQRAIVRRTISLTTGKGEHGRSSIPLVGLRLLTPTALCRRHVADRHGLAAPIDRHLQLGSDAHDDHDGQHAGDRGRGGIQP